MAYSLFLQINFFWNAVTPVHLHIIFSYFWATRAEWSSCNNDSVAHKSENICYLVLYRESLLTPAINDCLAKYLFILIPGKVNGWWLWLLFLFSRSSYITEPGGFTWFLVATSRLFSLLLPQTPTTLKCLILDFPIHHHLLVTVIYWSLKLLAPGSLLLSQ